MRLRMSALALGVTLVLTASGIAPAQATDQHGRSHELFGPPGVLTVIEFAASWCKPCVRSLPRIEEISRQHPELRYLVISVDETVERRDELVESLKLTLPVVWDFDYSIMEKLTPNGLPATMVFDSEGNRLYGHVGESEVGWERFLSFIESASSPEGSGDPTEPGRTDGGKSHQTPEVRR